MIIGIDVGGTHTDGVLLAGEKSPAGVRHEIIATSKVRTKKDNLMSSILEALDVLLIAAGKTEIRRIVLSTTLAANVIVEEKYDPVGLILIPGPGLNPEHLLIGEENLLLSGYINHRGKEVKGLDREELLQGLDKMRERDIRNLAIVSKFSTRNPGLEEEILEFIREKGYPFENITVGHQLSGRLSFPRRVFTAYFNTAIMAVYRDFVSAVKKALAERNLDTEVYILKCDGGTVSLDRVMVAPIETVNSGPAASIMGTMAMSRVHLTKETAIALDIGGTTTDIGLFINGEPVFMPEGIEINGLPSLIRGLYSLSLPLGGDSRISVVEGRIKIGPERDGPAAAFGGPSPTPTDALLVLGYLQEDPAYEASADLQAARGALAQLAGELDPVGYGSFWQDGEFNLTGFARNIIDLMLESIVGTIREILARLENKPVYTISELLAGIEINPKVLLAMGGPAKGLSPLLAEKLGYREELVPYAKVANAVGAALARPTLQTTVRVDTAASYLNIVEAGVHRKLKPGERYELEDVEELAITWTRKRAEDEAAAVEITERESFNVIRGFSTLGKIMEVKAQIKPGLISRPEGSEIG